MDGPVRMYDVKPIISRESPVELPACMYKMRNVLADDRSGRDSCPPRKLDVVEQVKQFLKDHQMKPDMADIHARQQKILVQLSELKEQILSLKNTLDVSDVSTNRLLSNVMDSVSDELKMLSDIVINVNPSNPPYMLLTLQKLWAGSLRIVIHSYTHSSVSVLTKEATQFVKDIQNNIDSAVPSMTIRLIWKKVDENIELITSSYANVIMGESNLMRFMSRIGPSSYNYENTNKPYEIDAVLDVCYLLSKSRTKTERHDHLQWLNRKLGKSQWLYNSERIGIADIVAASIIRQVATDGEVNVNLTKWLQRCQSV